MEIEFKYSILSNFINKRLQLIMRFSNHEQGLRWGCYIHKEPYAHDNSLFSGSVYIEGERIPLVNFAEYGQQPIFLIPEDGETNFVAPSMVDEGLPIIRFDIIKYYSNRVNPKTGDSNTEMTSFQRLRSELIFTNNQKKKGNFYCSADGTKEEDDPHTYFWILDCEGIDSVFNIKLENSHLNPSNTYSLNFSRSKDFAFLKFNNNDAFSWNFTSKELEVSATSLRIEDSWFSQIPEDSGLVYVDELPELKSWHYNKIGEAVTSIQLNNEIYTKYYCDGNNGYNLLFKAFELIDELRAALKFTKKSQPFALVPKLSIGSKYTIYGQYKVDDDVVTLISSMIDEEVNGSIHFDQFDNFPKLKIETQVGNFPEVNDNGTFAKFLIGEFSIKEQESLIDGVFQFDIAGTATYNDVYDHNGKISFVLQDRKNQMPLFLWQWDGTNDVEIGYSIEDFSLPVQCVKPFSQDLTSNEKYLAPSSLGGIVNGYGERLQKQLVVPLNDAGAKNEYYLCISESVNLGQDFRVDMRLIEVNPKAGNELTHRIQTVILDSSPQFVGLVDCNFLVQRGYDDGVWVLAQKIQSNLNQGVWEIFDDKSNQDGFNLMLPAQTIGEEFVKDISIDDTSILNYKFGAPAKLNLSGDKLEKNYVSPPWDLRRLWGQAGDIQPGLPLLKAEFELLYGMQANLKPHNTSVAELGARLGDLPVPFNNNLAWQATKEQIDSFHQNWINYLKYYRAWKSRLAILETYRANEPEVGATFAAPNMINEELDYKPRLNIEINQPRSKIINKINQILDEIRNIEERLKKEINEVTINSLGNELISKSGSLNDLYTQLKLVENPNIEGFLTGAQLAIPSKAIKDEIVKIDGNDISLAAFHEALHGSDENFIKGGFTYGFQDKEIYKSFLQAALTEGSTSAELSGLAFSSQGGYGKQVARFDNDLTAIKSLTAMGRVHRYAVERIGRIGVFWHKAKHVIEYERTVVRSEYETEYQHPLSGRPIVRKIREYIEILEPEKKYPDFENHSSKDTGAVNACIFKSTILPISNSWGRIVYTADKSKQVGWEVPLWYEGADETLFPRPQIFFLLEPPKDANLSHSTAQLTEPQNLVFYTAYMDGINEEKPGKDVSSWKSVYEVDFTDKPIFDESVLQPYDSNSTDKNRMDKPMPDAIDVLPGHGRFTFKVEPQQTPAGMANVYQPDSGLSGVMRTVSLQRNGDITSKNKVDLNIEMIPISTLFNSDSDIASIKAQFEKIKESVSKLATVQKSTYLIDLVPHSEVGLLSSAAQILWYKILQYSEDFLLGWNDVKTRIKAETKKVAWVVETEFLKIDAYELQLSDLLSGLKWLYTLSDEQLKRLENFKKSFFEILKSNDNSKADKVWFTNTKDFIKEEFNKLKKEFDFFDDPKIEDIIERVGKTVLDKINDYQLKVTKAKKAVLSEISQLIDDINFEEISKFQNELDESLNRLLNEIHKINGEIENLKTSILASIDDTKTLLDNVKLEDLVKEFLAKLFLKIAKFDTFLNTIEPFKSIDKAETNIKKLLDEANPKIHEIQSKLNNYISLATTKIDQVNKAVGSGSDFTTEANNVLTNYRSVWEEISAPGMGLNRKTIALIVNKVENAKQVEQQLSVTPCIAKYKQFESDLNALGVRLPVTHIFNELKAPTEEWLKSVQDTANEKAAAISKYLGDIKFPESLTNLGAMDFGGMLKGVSSSDLYKHVIFSQGFDKENLSAWAKANLDYKMPDPTESMFSISAASVWLTNAHLTAEIEGNANADGVVSKKEYGELLGDFAIKIGNNPLITFEKTKVIYKDGKLDLDLDPSRMKMDGVLKMITDATQNLNQFNNDAKAQKDESGSKEDSNKPFKVKILKATINQLLNEDKTVAPGNNKTSENKTDPEKVKEELGKFENEARKVEVPYGVKATLDIPAISVGGGTTSMTNLSFGGQFVLRFFNPEAKKLEFVTGLGFYIGKREAPFNFTAFIFGGGGFVDTLIYYSEESGTELDFVMSIHASAGLFFNVGWASGSVFIYLGLEGQYSYRKSIGSNMTFTLFAQLVGTLNIMGLVSAYLIVRLALSYDSYGMIGTGYISVEIEICWCVTISVSSSFQKQFTGSKQEQKQQKASISASLG